MPDTNLGQRNATGRLFVTPKVKSPKLDERVIVNSPFTVSSGSIVISDHLIPDTDDSYDIGSATYEFQDAWFDGTITTDGRCLGVVVKTDTYTATSDDNVIVCNKASAMTINLPAATGTGREYIIKNINTGLVTIDGNGSETIDGSTTASIMQWESAQIVDYSSGAWIII
jgi:hypothetical protein